MSHGGMSPQGLQARAEAVRIAQSTWRRLAVALMAVALLIAAPGTYAAAQTRIGINGGRPANWPILDSLLAGAGLTQEGWLAFASDVGANWLPDASPVPLDYPAQFGPLSAPGGLTVDQSVGVGQQRLHAAILEAIDRGEHVVVAGLSMGTLVIDRELAYLATAPDAPEPSKVTFYVFGDPSRGFGQKYMSGVTIPIVGQTFHPIPETKYDTVVVMEQWDGWANPPDRPWNLLAVVNAIMGAVYTVNGSNDHSATSLASMADALQVSHVQNSQGGWTTTYLIPRDDLPITRPLRQLGVPGWIVDEFNELLMPIIATGYSSMTPYLGPYIDRGQLVFTPPVAPTLQSAAPVNPVDAATVDDAPVDGGPTTNPTSELDHPSVDDPVTDAKPISTALGADAIDDDAGITSVSGQGTGASMEPESGAPAALREKAFAPADSPAKPVRTSDVGIAVKEPGDDGEKAETDGVADGPGANDEGAEAKRTTTARDATPAKVTTPEKESGTAKDADRSKPAADGGEE